MYSSMNYYPNTVNQTFFPIFFTIIFPLMFLVALCVQVLIGYLVYKDAVKHNFDNPILWGVISGITWIGLVVYFVVNKRDK